jgi:PST family polysaccharide transporter
MEMYGLVAFAQSFAQYFTLLTDYGFNFSATRSIARQEGDYAKISRIFSSVMLIKLLLALVGGMILVGVVDLIPRFHENGTFFFVAYAAVVGNVLFPTWYFQGIEQMRYISIIIGAFRLLGAVALFIFIHKPSDALLALAIQSFALMAGGAVGLWVAFRRFKLSLSWPEVAQVKASIADGWHLFISTAAISLYTNTNVFLVGLLAGNLQAGYFSAAEKLIRGMQGLLIPVSQAIFPHMSSLALQSKDLLLRLASRVLRWMGSISLAASIFIFLLARPVGVLFFGPSAVGSVPIIHWIAFLPFLVAISNVLGIQTMVSLGLDKQFSRILILAGLFNIALGVPLIRVYAACGAGISVLLTELLVTTVMILELNRHEVKLSHLMGISA